MRADVRGAGTDPAGGAGRRREHDHRRQIPASGDHHPPRDPGHAAKELRRAPENAPPHQHWRLLRAQRPPRRSTRPPRRRPEHPTRTRHRGPGPVHPRLPPPARSRSGRRASPRPSASRILLTTEPTMTTTGTDTGTQLAAHLDPARKHDFAFLFDVRDGNPNGDPDAGGMPRLDPETMQGLVTDVAIKRKIRNMVDLLGER